MASKQPYLPGLDIQQQPPQPKRAGKHKGSNKNRIDNLEKRVIQLEAENALVSSQLEGDEPGEDEGE
ncbi:MAG: hypothetical protein GH143_06545 [Calditrichaeota bacterium]|nr:hypothetical protein [Calditrichota bacterium]